MNPDTPQGFGLSPTQFALRATLVAVAWTALFKLNAWAFSDLVVDRYVAWIFLPAGLRMLGVLLFDWPAVVGLWIGTLATNHPIVASHLSVPLAVALVSACAPCMAAKLGRRWFSLPLDLSGMRGWHLLALSLMSAAFNALLTQSTLALLCPERCSLSSMLVMFCGDLAGTFILLYLAVAALFFYDRLALKRS